MNAGKWDQNRYHFGALFLVAAVLAQAAPLFWLRGELPRDVAGEAQDNADLYQFTYPVLDYAFGRLRAGELPLWNPRQLCGTPLLADHRVGLMQPLNLAFFAMPTGRAMAVHAFLSLFLMGLFFAIFMRSLDVRYVPALVGAVAYAFCGASAAAMSRPATASALVWMPLLFWAGREHARDDRAFRGMLVGLTGALLLLTGAYALAAAVLLLFVPYRCLLVLFPGPEPPRGFWGRAKGLAPAAAVALLLSAVQWVPTTAWLVHLERPGDVFWNLQYAGRAPARLGELLAHLFTTRPESLPRIGYMGAIALVVTPAAFFRWDRLREVVFFTIMGVAMLLLAAAGPPRLFLGIPREAMAFGAAFCLAVLAALGTDRLLAPRVDFHSPNVWLPAILVIALSAVVFALSGSQGRGYLFAFLLVLLPSLALRQPWLTTLSGIACALLLFTDLTVANNNAYRHPFQDAPGCYQRYAESVDAAREYAVGGRVLVSSRRQETALPANLGMIYPVDAAGGAYLPLTPEQAAWWQRLRSPGETAAPVGARDVAVDAPQPSLIDYMAVRVIIAAPDAPLRNGVWTQDGPRLRESQRAGDARLFINEDALPRAYWVPQWRLAEGIYSTLDALAAQDFDPARECIVAASDAPALDRLRDTAQPPDPDASAARPDASCALTQVSPESVELTVNAPTAGITVLADTHLPGWKAFLNGERAPLVRVNGLFRGVPTPPGEHSIRLVYRPAAPYLGMALAVAGLLLAAAITAYSMLRPR